MGICERVLRGKGNINPQSSDVGQSCVAACERMAQLTAQERSVYDALFQKADLDRDGLLGAHEVVFFRKSGVPDATLGKIWILANPQKNSALDRDQFNLCLRLISQVQAGREADLELAKSSRPHPLPHFAETPVQAAKPLSSTIITPQQRAKWAETFHRADTNNDGYVTGEEARVLFSSSGLSTTDLSKIWTLSDANNDRRLDKTEFVVSMFLISARIRGEDLPDVLPPSVVASAAGEEPVTQGSPSPSPSPSHSSSASSLPQVAPDPWLLTEPLLQQYGAMYRTVDADGDGRVSPKDVKPLFARSALPAAELNWVWNLVDIQKKMFLTISEFAVAMLLLTRRKQGVPLPQILPPPLANFLSGSSSSSPATSGSPTMMSPAYGGSPAPHQHSLSSRSLPHSPLCMSPSLLSPATMSPVGGSPVISPRDSPSNAALSPSHLPPPSAIPGPKMVQSNYADLKKHVDSLHRRKEDFSLETEAGRRELEELKQLIAVKQQERDELSREVGDLQQRAESVTGELRRTRELHMNLNEEISSLAGERANLMKLIVEAEESIQLQANVSDSMKTRLKELRAEIGSLEAQHAQTKAMVEQKHSERDSEDQILRTSQKRIDELKEQLKTMQATSAQLSKEMESLTKKSAAAKKELATVTKTHESVSEKHEEILKQHTELEEEIRKDDELLGKRKEDIKKWQEDIKTFEKENKKLKEQHSKNKKGQEKIVSKHTKLKFLRSKTITGTDTSLADLSNSKSPSQGKKSSTDLKKDKKKGKENADDDVQRSSSGRDLEEEKRESSGRESAKSGGKVDIDMDSPLPLSVLRSGATSPVLTPEALSPSPTKRDTIVSTGDLFKMNVQDPFGLLPDVQPSGQLENSIGFGKLPRSSLPSVLRNPVQAKLKESDLLNWSGGVSGSEDGSQKGQPAITTPPKNFNFDDFLTTANPFEVEAGRFESSFDFSSSSKELKSFDNVFLSDSKEGDNPPSNTPTSTPSPAFANFPDPFGDDPFG